MAASLLSTANAYRLLNPFQVVKPPKVSKAPAPRVTSAGSPQVGLTDTTSSAQALARSGGVATTPAPTGFSGYGGASPGARDDAAAAAAFTAPKAPGAPTPPTPPPAAPGAPSIDSIMGFLNSNPALAAVQAGNARDGIGAASDEAAAVKNLLLGYGSRTVAQDILGKLAESDPRLKEAFGNTDAFVNATDANGNPVISDDPEKSTSTLAQLARNAAKQKRTQDESFNDSNLFFSGARAGAANDLAYTQQLDSAGKRSDLESALTAAALGLPNADNAANSKYLDAYQAAYNAALQEAMQFPGGTAGTPPDSGAAPPPDTTAPPPAAAPVDPGFNFNNWATTEPHYATTAYDPNAAPPIDPALAALLKRATAGRNVAA